MILKADARQLPPEIANESVQCVVTSPPYYGLRNYETGRWSGGDTAHVHQGSERYYTEKTAARASGEAFSKAGDANAARIKAGRWREGGACACGAIWIDSQIGLEHTPEEYVAQLVAVFREVKRVLKPDGVLWLNIGDSYNNAGSSRNGEGLDGIRRGGATGPDGALGYKRRDTRHSLGAIKYKDLMGIPWRLAFALQDDGWYLRCDVIWEKPSIIPDGATDRPTRSHEYLFLLSKGPRPYYDADAIRQPLQPKTFTTYSSMHSAQANDISGNVKSANWARTVKKHKPKLAANGAIAGANKRSVWRIYSKGLNLGLCKACQRVTEKDKQCARCNGPLIKHFAAFPPALVEPCIKAGSRPGDLVFDPFLGTGTVGEVAAGLGRRWVGTEINEDYIAIAKYRTGEITLESEFS